VTFVHSAPVNERILFAALAWLAHDLVVYPFHLFVYILYKYNLLSSYKIRSDKLPDPDLVKKAFRKCLIDTIIFPFFGYYVLYNILVYNGSKIDDPLPSVWVMLFQILFFFFVNDTAFFWTHYALHSKLLYTSFHKKHHLFNTSTSVAAEYNTPFEGIFSAVGPTLLGFIIMPYVHPLTFVVYVAVRMTETLEAHSGYDLPNPWRYLRGSSRFHDYHHSHNIGNYGLFPFTWDSWLGTDAHYKNFIAKGETGDKKAK